MPGSGWTPVDPADVRKVALEEPPGNLALQDPKVEAARKALFGSWETNWLAYNFAHDVTLPGSTGGKLGFLMYPQAETGKERLDLLPQRLVTSAGIIKKRRALAWLTLQRGMKEFIELLPLFSLHCW